MTQKQANAIAEREYPLEPLPEDADWTAKTARQMLERIISVERQAYAKCLMDMNPLIEAGDKAKEALRYNLAVYARKDEPMMMDAFNALSTALSNLTKNIEPK